ncbi:o-succinylbenzoate--CoA ligase [Bacillus kwashiorkori]|uniref:o-succinylbenzoate--CoA ligase n=1 Tax=Bacillus kwashiorkori TaxID=1522318 RepID=UPI00078061A3|nr:o-succinylbenzoate--CoA ligase [Bacillus kwashiorkori]
MHSTEVIPNWLVKRASLTPNKIAIVFQGQVLTFQELFVQVKCTSKRLTTLGIKKGDRVATFLNNHIDTVITLHSLQLIGCTTILLNTRLSEQELLFQLTDSGVKHLIVDQSIFPIKSKIGVQIITKAELEQAEEAEFPLVREFTLTDICTILYTSGTTGFPKGVCQSYGNHWWSAIGSALNLGLHDNDTWLLSVPLFHISGFSILIRSVIYGIPIILHEKFDEKKINDELISGRTTIISVVSTMVSRLLEDLENRNYHPNFRCMLLGGGPISQSLLEKCKEKKIPIFQTYGMTETASQIVTLSPEYSMVKLGSAGKPLFPAQLKIIKDGMELQAMEIGEIVVKGPNVTSGYYNRPTANKESFTSDGWFFTGDVGYLDKEGFLYVVDRRSDLIISGGENVYPAEIENVIQSHKAIAEAAVTGINDQQWGQVPIAFYVVKKGYQVSEVELISFCQQRLAKYKIPKKWREVNELPRNGSNKILRRLLKQLVIDERID